MAYTACIPAGGGSQAGLCEASLLHITSSRTARTTNRDHVQTQKKKKKKRSKEGWFEQDGGWRVVRGFIHVGRRSHLFSRFFFTFIVFHRRIN